MTEHRCLRGVRCAHAEMTEGGRRLGAGTPTPNTLCDGCARRVERALGRLPVDYAELELIVATERTARERVAGTPELPVPPRLDVLELQAAIDAELSTWVEPVAERLGIDWDTQLAASCRPGPRVSRAAGILAVSVPTLLRLGPVDVMGWLAGIRPVTRLGVEGAIALLDLHQRARLLVSGGSGDVRLPVPCPRCEGVLIRPNGASHVACASCPAQWPEDQYRRLCLVLAQDFRDAA